MQLLRSSYNCRKFSILIIFILLSGCTPKAAPGDSATLQAPLAVESQPDETSVTSRQPQTNLSAGCIENYSADVDYFPEKIRVSHAAGFNVTYHKHYKVVTVTQQQGDTLFEKDYVLVQCGTPVPQGYESAEIVEIPIKTVVSMSTTHFPFLEEYGALDRLIGIDDATYVNNPTVLKMVEDGKIAIVGAGAGVNVEKLLEMQPDLIFAYSSGIPNYDAFPRLISTSLKVALVAEHSEATPLGRAEWGKYMALFFNREAAAEKAYSGTVARYLETLKTVSQVKNRPTVFLNSLYQGAWYMAGGKTYMAQFLSDAGADYLWQDNPATSSVMLSFEEVLNRAVDAEFWLPTTYWQTAADAIKEDERYAKFRAFQTGQIYNNNYRSSAGGGNDFYESGTAHPDVILADLVKIFHPELLPDYEMVFFQQLPAE